MRRDKTKLTDTTLITPTSIHTNMTKHQNNMKWDVLLLLLKQLSYSLFWIL